MKKDNGSGMNKLNQANILSVSIRVLVAVALAVGIYFLRASSGIDSSSVFITILCGVMALGGLICVIQLIIWGLKWVAQERVSELGLHIVRFGVILTAVVLSIFTFMSRDYNQQYLGSVENELCQQALAGRIYVQQGIGENVGDSIGYYDNLYTYLRQMLVDNTSNRSRHVCLYLINQTGTDFSESLIFSPVKDSNIVAASTGTVTPTANAEYIERIMADGTVQYRTYTTDDGSAYSAACTPVFSESGRPIGVLEVCEKESSSIISLQFASTDFLLTVAAIIMLFAFLFYGVMQFVDIIMRPHNADPSKKILICGREAARPVMFFVTMTAALPIMMLMNSESFRGLITADFLPDALSAGAPLIVYILGLYIGSAAVRREKDKLTEMPSNAGLAAAFLCNVGMILLMDWSGAAGKSWNNFVVILVLLLISGLGCGISYRTIAKYQGQSDALFGYDKYAYLSSCLGGVAGIALGAVLADYSGEFTVRIVLALLSAFTVVLSIWLLQDLEKTVETGSGERREELRSYAGVIVGLIPVGAACCYVWMYITSYLRDAGYGVASIAFCAAMPVVAFCFGNRLRVKADGAQSKALLISGILAGCAFIPMLFDKWHTVPMALLSVLLTSLSVIFAASAVYSFMNKKEIGHAATILAPMALLGIILLTILSGMDSWLWKCAFIVASGLAASGAVLGKAPARVVVQEGLIPVKDDEKKVAKPPKEKKQKPEKAEKKPAGERRNRLDDVLAGSAVGENPESEDYRLPTEPTYAIEDVPATQDADPAADAVPEAEPAADGSAAPEEAAGESIDELFELIDKGNEEITE